MNIEEIMKKQAVKQNTAHNYTALHGFTWFVFGLIGVVCSLVGGWSDGEVLYSIFYNSTSQPIYSLIKSILGALLIQVLIWGGCGQAFKMLLYKKWDLLNVPHLIIYILLGVAGFAATFYLSTQTHSPLLLKTKTQQQHHQHQYSQQLATLDSVGDDALEDLREEYVKDSTLIQNRYHALIYADTITYSHKIGTYIGRWKRGEISGDKRDVKINVYKGKIKEAVKPHLKDREEEIKQLNHNYKRAVDSCRAVTEFAVADVKEAGVKVEGELKDNTRLAGSVLIGKNLAFNSISILLILGLQFFYKGVNSTTPPPQPKQSKLNIQLTPTPHLGMMDGALQQRTTPNNGEVEVLENEKGEEPTHTKIHPTDPPEHLWGTIEGNRDSEFRAEGSLGKRRIIMKYFGKNGVTFVSKAYIKGQYQNRVQKASTTKNLDAKKRNQDWADFWYKRLIEAGNYERGMFDKK